MWYTLNAASDVSPDFLSSANELLQSTLRNLILAAGGVYLAWHLVVTVIWPEEFGWNIWYVSVVVVLTFVLSLRLVERKILAAQALWHLGITAAITLAVYLFKRPEIAFLYVLLPLGAVIIVGWLAGLAMNALILLLVWWLSTSPIMPALPVTYGLGIVLGGAFTGLLGWATGYSLLTTLHWSLHSYTMAEKNMQDARQHRAKLARVLKDLDQAYYRLERSNAVLVAARKAAEDAERFKADFVNNVSHELRTPLNLIIGFSEMMMTSPESYDGQQIPGAYRGDLNAIYHNARHLLALVDDVLDLARIEAGRIGLMREEVSLPSLLDETIGMVKDYVSAKGLDLKVQLSPDLPPVFIDRLRIRQVILNLLVNAARFTESGWITIAVSQQGEEVMVRVADTGQGIRMQDLPTVFEEFRATDQPPSSWHSGTGLGLPISKKLVELHHGRMGVESTYLQGSTFWFTLPCGPVCLPEREPRQIDRPRTHVQTRTREPAVIVVHQDPNIAPMLQRYLDGYRVLGVPDLEEGAAVVREVNAVAVVAEPAGPQPMLASGPLFVNCPLPNGRRAAKALGADNLLVKPVSRQRLLAAIDAVGRPVRRVLIADDDPEIVRLFKRMLRTRIPSRSCLEAYNGAEALRLIRTDRPDLVLLDMVMPEMDGRAVLKEMTVDPALADIPVIVVSAKDLDQASIHLRGPIHVERPGGFQLGEVVRTLEALLNALRPDWHPVSSTPPQPAGAPLE